MEIVNKKCVHQQTGTGTEVVLYSSHFVPINEHYYLHLVLTKSTRECFHYGDI